MHPDRARSEHEDLLAEQRAGAPHRVQAHRDRLRKSRLVERQRLRNRNRLLLLTHQLLAKAAVHVRDPHCAAVEAYIGAMVAQSSLAEGADAARQTWIDGDALTRTKRLYVGAGLDHDASDLVTQHHRMAKPNGAETAVAVIVKIGAADAADCDLHPHAMGTQWQARHVFVAQIFRSVDDNGFHVILSGVLSMGVGGSGRRTQAPTFWIDSVSGAIILASLIFSGKRPAESDKGWLSPPARQRPGRIQPSSGSTAAISMPKPESPT